MKKLYFILIFYKLKFRFTKNIFLFGMLIFSGSILGQRLHTHKDYALYIASKLNTKQYIDSIVDVDSGKFKSKIVKIIKDKNITNKKDKDFLLDIIQEKISFEKQNIWNNFIYNLSRKEKKELRHFVKLIKDNNLLELKSKLLFNKSISDLFIKDYNDFKSVNLPKLIAVIKKKYRGIPVNIYLNNKKIEDASSKISLSVKLKDKSGNLIEITDSTNSRIQKPNIDDFSKLESLVLMYKENIFVFSPKQNSSRMPAGFKQMTNILSEYNFTKVDSWNIYITEKKGLIRVELENSDYQKQEKQFIVEN